MKPNTTRLLAVLLAVLVVGVAFAPLGVASSGPIASQSADEPAIAASPATSIDESPAAVGGATEFAGSAVVQTATAVGVVGDGAYADDLVGLLENATGADVTVESVSSEEALGSDHDVYVVQHIADANVADFVSATSGGDVGVVYLDQFDEASQDANGVRQFASVSDAVDGVDENYDPNESTDGPNYVVRQSHPIVDGSDVGDEIRIHTEAFSDYAWITGTSFDVVADVGVDGSTDGIGLAVDEDSATVLAASSGLNQYARADFQTDAAVGLLVNAIDHLAGGDGDPGPGEDFVRLGEASAAEGGTATVAMDTDVSNVAGYQARIDYDSSVFTFVDASGVDLDDPVVNDEDGTVTLSASQASGVDAPTLVELTFEAVGESGESTDLVFDQEFTQLNTEDSVVQPQEYVSGSLTVGDGGAECEVLGDADDSGDVTSLDATLTQQYIAGLDPGGFENPECADVTDDGDITPADVTGINQIIVGIWA